MRVQQYSQNKSRKQNQQQKITNKYRRLIGACRDKRQKMEIVYLVDRLFVWILM